MKMFRVFRETPPWEYASAGLVNNGDRPDFEGVIFDDGTVACRWLTTFASHVVWPNYETLYSVHIDPHLHYGARVEWSDTF